MSRQSERYQVALKVRFQTAREFVEEYAENLSGGGLFIKTLRAYEPLEEIAVELDLPGAGRFRVAGQVAHILSSEQAARFGRSPGIGVHIVKEPPGFREALSAYLLRLGNRADHAVLVHDDAHRELLEQTGYRVGPAPPSGQLALGIVRSNWPVVGVVVPSERAAPYAAAAAAAGAGDIVVPMDTAGELDTVLARLDAGLGL